jgi:hypothetical protein
MYRWYLNTRQELSRQELDWLVRTIQIHTTAMVGAALRAYVRRTVHRRGRRCRRGSGGGVTSYTSAASVEDRSRRSYRLYRGGSCGGLETSRGGAGGGQEQADIEGARSRSHGPEVERPELGLGEPESAHHWTGTTCRAAPLACSDWSEERDGHGRIGSKAVEITGSRVGRAA